MRSIEEFVRDTAEQGRSHVFYERGMYSLTVDLERIAKVLRDPAWPSGDRRGSRRTRTSCLTIRSRSFVTRDVDLLVDRRELPTIVAAGRAAGYEAKKIVGGYMLIRSGQTPAEAVHLIFAGEKSEIHAAAATSGIESRADGSLRRHRADCSNMRSGSHEADVVPPQGPRPSPGSRRGGTHRCRHRA